MFCSVSSAATTYYVRTDGNNANSGTVNSSGGAWATMAFAVTQAINGDIIRVVTGTHTVSTQLTLPIGVSVEGDGIGASVINSTQTGVWSVLFELNSADNTNGNQHISGLTINGGYVAENNVKTWVAIWVTGRKNVTVFNCSFNNFKQSAIIFNGINTDNPGTDVGYVKATGNKVYNCDIQNCSAMYNGTGQGAVMFGFQDGFEIYGCTIVQTQRANFLNGWPIKYWNQGWLDGCKIYNNVLTKKPYAGTYPGENGDWDFCIELFSIAGLQIYGNTIQGSIDLNYNYKKGYDYSVWIHDNTLSHSVLNSKYESTVILEFRTEAVLIENNVVNNRSNFVQFNTRGVADNGGDRENFVGGNTPGGYSYLVDNIIRQNVCTNIYQGDGIGTSGGILVISEGTDDPQVKNLRIYNNTIVAKSGDAPAIALDFTSQPNGNADSIFIRNNIIQGFGTAWIKGSNGATNMNHTAITNNCAYGNGNSNAASWPAGNPLNYTYSSNITSSPLFVSSADYSLQPGSPCIDAGVNIGLPYNGSAPDIGKFESGGSPGNLSPTANAGLDQTVTLPTSSVSLSGSGNDSDGTISAYLWTRISGPNTPTIVSATSSSTSVTGLVEGVYVFQLQVTDNLGDTGIDQIQVTVNSASSPSSGTIRFKRKIRVN